MAKIDNTWLDAFDVLLQVTVPGRVLLELGCGEGRDTRRLTSCGGEVLAVDHRFDALRTCRSRAPGALPVRLDIAASLPFPDRRFALVMANLSLHHFDASTTRAVMREVRRVLRDDGALVLRVDSARDVNYGATGVPEIEPGVHLVKGYRKRFFDRDAIVALASSDDWRLLSLEERLIDRYERPKHIWQAVLGTGMRKVRAIRVEAATAEDCAAVALVHVLSWQYAYRRQLPAAFLESLSVDDRVTWWARAIREADPSLLVARDEDRVVGFVAFGASRDDDAASGTAEIQAIYVSPLHWGCGAGSALLSVARERLRASGYRRVTLWVIEGNECAFRFYARHGFVGDGTPAKTFEIDGTPLQERRLLLRL